MDLTPELYLQVERYLDNEISRQDLEDWLVPRLEVLLTPLSTASDLAAEIELGLAEYSHGDVSEEELRRTIGEFVRSRPLIVRWPATAHLSVSESTAKLAMFSALRFCYDLWHSPLPESQNAPSEPIRRRIEFVLPGR